MIKVAINLILTLSRAFAGGGTMAQDPLLLIQCHRRHICFITSDFKKTRTQRTLIVRRAGLSAPASLCTQCSSGDKRWWNIPWFEEKIIHDYDVEKSETNVAPPTESEARGGVFWANGITQSVGEVV